MELTVHASPEVISGYLLALVRAGAWVAVSPPFGTRVVPAQVKAGFAAALALALGPRVAEAGVPLEVGPLLTAAVLQVVVGLALGFVGVVLVSAVQAAGSLVDLGSGLGMAQVLDPMSGSVVSVFGRFYQLLATTLLFATGGHLVLVRGFMASFDAAPLTTLSLAGVSDLLTRDLGTLMLAAVQLAAPILGALFLAEVALGLLARAAPNMNVFLLGMPVKILIAFAVTGLALVLLPGAVDGLVSRAVRQGLGLVGAMGAGG
ncbi:MAG: flagellar biosynthetic protein FliR [Acidimicrobiia bacterium]